MIADFQTITDGAYGSLKMGTKFDRVIRFVTHGVGNVNSLGFSPRPKHRLKNHIVVIPGFRDTKTKT